MTTTKNIDWSSNCNAESSALTCLYYMFVIGIISSAQTFVRMHLELCQEYLKTTSVIVLIYFVK
jgi:hypothetical protein